MTKGHSPSEDSTDLRRQAEERLRVKQRSQRSEALARMTA